MHSDSAEWMFGRLGRNEGLFPVNFIHVVIPPPEKRLPQLQTEQNTAPQQKHITVSFFYWHKMAKSYDAIKAYSNEFFNS